MQFTCKTYYYPFFFFFFKQYVSCSSTYSYDKVDFPRNVVERFHFFFKKAFFIKSEYICIHVHKKSVQNVFGCFQF